MSAAEFLGIGSSMVDSHLHRALRLAQKSTETSKLKGFSLLAQLYDAHQASIKSASDEDVIGSLSLFTSVFVLSGAFNTNQQIRMSAVKSLYSLFATRSIAVRNATVPFLPQLLPVWIALRFDPDGQQVSQIAINSFACAFPSADKIATLCDRFSLRLLEDFVETLESSHEFALLRVYGALRGLGWLAQQSPSLWDLTVKTILRKHLFNKLNSARTSDDDRLVHLGLLWCLRDVLVVMKSFEAVSSSSNVPSLVSLALTTASDSLPYTKCDELLGEACWRLVLIALRRATALVPSSNLASEETDVSLLNSLHLAVTAFASEPLPSTSHLSQLVSVALPHLLIHCTALSRKKNPVTPRKLSEWMLFQSEISGENALELLWAAAQHLGMLLEPDDPAWLTLLNTICSKKKHLLHKLMDQEKPGNYHECILQLVLKQPKLTLLGAQVLYALKNYENELIAESWKRLRASTDCIEINESEQNQFRNKFQSFTTAVASESTTKADIESLFWAMASGELECYVTKITSDFSEISTVESIIHLVSTASALEGVEPSWLPVVWWPIVLTNIVLMRCRSLPLQDMHHLLPLLSTSLNDWDDVTVSAISQTLSDLISRTQSANDHLLLPGLVTACLSPQLHIQVLKIEHLTSLLDCILSFAPRVDASAVVDPNALPSVTSNCHKTKKDIASSVDATLICMWIHELSDRIVSLSNESNSSIRDFADHLVSLVDCDAFEEPQNQLAPRIVHALVHSPLPLDLRPSCFWICDDEVWRYWTFEEKSLLSIARLLKLLAMEGEEIAESSQTSLVNALLNALRIFGPLLSQRLVIQSVTILDHLIEKIDLTLSNVLQGAQLLKLVELLPSPALLLGRVTRIWLTDSTTLNNGIDLLLALISFLIRPPVEKGMRAFRSALEDEAMNILRISKVIEREWNRVQSPETAALLLLLRSACSLWLIPRDVAVISHQARPVPQRSHVLLPITTTVETSLTAPATHTQRSSLLWAAACFAVQPSSLIQNDVYSRTLHALIKSYELRHLPSNGRLSQISEILSEQRRGTLSLDEVRAIARPSHLVLTALRLSNSRRDELVSTASSIALDVSLETLLRAAKEAQQSPETAECVLREMAAASALTPSSDLRLLRSIQSLLGNAVKLMVSVQRALCHAPWSSRPTWWAAAKLVHVSLVPLLLENPLVGEATTPELLRSLLLSTNTDAKPIKLNNRILKKLRISLNASRHQRAVYRLQFASAIIFISAHSSSKAFDLSVWPVLQSLLQNAMALLNPEAPKKLPQQFLLALATHEPRLLRRFADTVPKSFYEKLIVLVDSHCTTSAARAALSSLLPFGQSLNEELTEVKLPDEFGQGVSLWADLQQLQLSIRWKIEDEDEDALSEAAANTHTIRVAFPPGYPLRPAELCSFSDEVTSEFNRGAVMAGVPRAKWKQWLVQTRIQLGYSSGDSSSAFARIVKALCANVSSFFEGREPCPVCYCVVSSATRTVVDRRCVRCHSSFHGTCLIQWWRRSPEQVCPMCKSESFESI